MAYETLPSLRPEDRRRHPRTTVLMEGTIGEGERRSTCVLFNISMGGALVRVIDPFACPTSISIDIGRVGSIGARVVWRGLDAIGVAFEEEPRAIARRFLDSAQVKLAA